jgi:tRNA (guanine37-N1)-methyltransferase
MIRFDIITIFPEIFDSYFRESIIKRAQEKRKIRIYIHNLRDFTKDKHRTVDDKPYGGGAGMILKVEPIYRAVKNIRSKVKNPARNTTPARHADASHAGWHSVAGGQQSKIILFSPQGKKFDQKIAYQFSKLNHLILICGRYEGVDERVSKHIADKEISIGDYVLTGGELPAMVLVDAVSRLVPGVIAEGSLKEETFSGIAGEYPQYTRPEVFKPNNKAKEWKVPQVLLSGNHKKIEEWKQKHSKKIEK